MTQIVKSKSGCEIRLTDERWTHITEGHCELAGFRAEVLLTIEYPERILQGNKGEFLAVRSMQPGKNLIAVYREDAVDGFVITAFLTKRERTLDQRRQLWH